MKFKRLGDYSAALYNDFLGPRDAIPALLNKSANALANALESAEQRSVRAIEPPILQEARRHVRAMPASRVTIDKPLLYFGLRQYGTRNAEFHSGVLNFRRNPTETLRKIEKDLDELPLLLGSEESEDEKDSWTKLIEYFRSSRFFFDDAVSEWTLKAIEEKKPGILQDREAIIDHIRSSHAVIIDTPSENPDLPWSKDKTGKDGRTLTIG